MFTSLKKKKLFVVEVRSWKHTFCFCSEWIFLSKRSHELRQSFNNWNGIKTLRSHSASRDNEKMRETEKRPQLEAKEQNVCLREGGSGREREREGEREMKHTVEIRRVLRLYSLVVLLLLFWLCHAHSLSLTLTSTVASGGNGGERGWDAGGARSTHTHTLTDPDVWIYMSVCMFVCLWVGMWLNRSATYVRSFPQLGSSIQRSKRRFILSSLKILFLGEKLFLVQQSKWKRVRLWRSLL